MLLLSLLAAAVYAPACIAQEVRVHPEADAVTIPRETLPGLPVAIEVSLKNLRYGWGSNPDWVDPGFLSIEWDNIRVKVETPEERVLQIHRRDKRFIPPFHMQLERSATLRSKEWAAWYLDKTGPYFASPGEYLVRVQVRGPNEKWIEIPSQEVKVREPAGREQVAAKLFHGMDEEKHLLFLGVPLDSQDPLLSRLRKLGSEFSDTPYGKYAIYLLAHQAAARAVRVKNSEDEPDSLAQLRVAVGLLRHLEKNDPPENIRMEVQLDLAKYYIRLRDRRNAAACLDHLEKMNPPEPLRSFLKSLRDSLTRPLPGEPEGR